MSLKKAKRRCTGRTSPQRRLVLIRADPKPMWAAIVPAARTAATGCPVYRRNGSVSCDENAPIPAVPLAVHPPTPFDRHGSNRACAAHGSGSGGLQPPRKREAVFDGPSSGAVVSANPTAVSPTVRVSVWCLHSPQPTPTQSPHAHAQVEAFLSFLTTVNQPS